MKLIVVLLLAFCGFALYLLLLQHRLIYFPRSYGPDPLPFGGISLTYPLGSGQQTAFYLPPRDTMQLPRRIWLILGGNASLALDWLSFARRFPDQDTAFLLFDYPGFGRCAGRASPSTIMASLERCLLALATELHLEPQQLDQRLGILGHSLGSAVALRLALTHPVQNLILLSPFTSMLEMAKRVVPFPFYHLLLHRLDNIAALDLLLSRPDKPAITILHGSRDEIVPVAMARTLARSHQGDLVYIEVNGAHHNDLIDIVESDLHRLMTRTR